MTDKPDSRDNAYRADLANIALRGRVTAERYVEGRQAVVCEPVVNLHAQPSAAAAIDTQALLGETVRVFDEAEGWSWVQLDVDHGLAAFDITASSMVKPICAAPCAMPARWAVG